MVTGIVPHVGGPISGPGCPTVLVGGLPAARVSDLGVCVGPPDLIALGSTGVFIGGMPAARMGDTTAHGGTIVLGFPTVLIGETAAGGGGGGAGGGGGGGGGASSTHSTGASHSGGGNGGNHESNAQAHSRAGASPSHHRAAHTARSAGSQAHVKRGLDARAARAANEALWRAHPELKGRQLTAGPKDAAYRKAWMQYYRAAEGSQRPTVPQTRTSARSSVDKALALISAVHDSGPYQIGQNIVATGLDILKDGAENGIIKASSKAQILEYGEKAQAGLVSKLSTAADALTAVTFVADFGVDSYHELQHFKGDPSEDQLTLYTNVSKDLSKDALHAVADGPIVTASTLIGGAIGILCGSPAGLPGMGVGLGGGAASGFATGVAISNQANKAIDWTVDHTVNYLGNKLGNVLYDDFGLFKPKAGSSW